MFKAHTIESAPQASAEVLRGVEKKMGFVPNLFAHLAESPTATRAYVQLSSLLEDSSLSAQELQIVLLTISVENGCEFCAAAHTAGGTQAKVDTQTLEAVRAGELPSEARDAALVHFVRRVIRERGWVDEAEVREFVDAGFSEAHVLDIITAAALKTISNYSNHVTRPSLNPELEKFAWDGGQRKAAAG